MRDLRAFSLIEMMIAIAVSSVIALAAVSAFVGVSRVTRRAEQQAVADQEAKLLTDYVMTAVQESGGGLVRPWMGVEMQDACTASTTVNGKTMPACSGSDRLHVTTVRGSQCQITGVVGNVVAGTAGSCCLDNTFVNKTVVVYAADGSASNGQWRADRAVGVDTTACTLTLAGAASGFSTATAATSFVNGVVSVGQAYTVYLDGDVLKAITDTNDDGAPDVLELSDGVADFQVKFGFDTNGDQIVDTWQASFASPVSRNMLRELAIGIIVAAPVAARDTPSSAQLFNGPTRSATRGKYMRKVSTRGVFRNLNIFF